MKDGLFTNGSRVFAVFVFFVIVISSFLPGGSGMAGPWNLGHVLAYAVLTCATTLSLSPSRRTLGKMLLLGTGIALLGGMIEWLQPLAGRRTSWLDMISNGIGIVIGLVGCLVSGMVSRPRAAGNRSGRDVRPVGRRLTSSSRDVT